MGFIKDSSNVGSTKVIRYASDYYVNADIGNDANDGFSSATPFATIEKAIKELQEYYWADVVSLTLEGATLLSSFISISGINIDIVNAFYINVGTDTLRFTGSLLIENFVTVIATIYTQGSGSTNFGRIKNILSDSYLDLKNISGSSTPFAFEEVENVVLSSPLRFSGTINLTNSLFRFIKVYRAYLDLSFIYTGSVQVFTPPLVIDTLVSARDCGSVLIEHSAFPITGRVYNLINCSLLMVSGYLGANKITGTVPDSFLQGSNQVFDLTLNKFINYNNTASGLVARNYQDAIDELNNLRGIKSSKGATTYYVNANTGNDANNGTAVATPFATIAKLVTELQRYFWTGDIFIHFQGATLLNTPITLSGVGIDALNGISLRVGIENTTTNYTNILTVTDFSIVNLSINLGNSGKVDFRRIDRVNSNSGSNRIRLNNILSTGSPVFNFEDIQYLDLSRAIACQGTINVQGSLFFIGPVDYGEVDLSNLSLFTAPRNIEVIVQAYACPQLQIENNAVSFIGQAYTLENVKLYSSDYYGINKLAGTLPDELLGGFVNNVIYDFATDKVINYDNTTSGLVAQNYEDGINELALRNNTERRLITTTSTLLDTSPSIQNVINTTGVVQTLNLPTSPTINKYFFIKNHSTSTGNLLVNSITVAPNNVYAVIWDGVEWMVL